MRRSGKGVRDPPQRCFGDKLEDGREAAGGTWERQGRKAGPQGRAGGEGPRRRGPSGDESTIERAAVLAPRGRDASQRAVHTFSTPAESGYTARRRVLGGATGALGALPGGGASGAGRGGRREREAAAARGAQAGQAAKGRRRRSTELRRRAPCSSRRDGPRRRRAEMSEKAQGRDEQGGAGPR